MTPQEIDERIKNGETYEQIANLYKNSGLTARPIRNDEIQFWLRERGLVLRGFDTPFTGRMVDAAKTAPAFVRNEVQQFVTHVYGNKPTLNTHTWEIAERGRELMRRLMQAGLIDEQDAADFYSLGGGLLYQDLTAQQVEQLHKGWQQVSELQTIDALWEQAKAEAKTAYLNGVQDYNAAGIAVIEGA